MSEPTKTIAFRVPQSIEDEINKIAKTSGQGKGEWVRDQVLQALAATGSRPPLRPHTTQSKNNFQASNLVRSRLS